jgi:hypothetical protein
MPVPAPCAEVGAHQAPRGRAARQGQAREATRNPTRGYAGMLPFIIAWMTCGASRFSAVKTGPRTALGGWSSVSSRRASGRPAPWGKYSAWLAPTGASGTALARKSRSWPGPASATASALNAAALAWVSVAGDQVIPSCPPGRSAVMGVLPWRAPVALPSARLAGWLVRWRGAGVRGRASRAATSSRVRTGA